MPSDARDAGLAKIISARSAGMNIASVRILRLALGTALCMLFSQIANWQLSFVAPVITMFVLCLPTPVPNLSGGIKFFLVFTIAVYSGLVFLPFLLNQRLVGLLLLGLALYHSFYFTARGGSAVIGTLATIGLAVVTAIGTVSIDAVLQVSGGLSVGALVGILFVWMAHGILPDSTARQAAETVPVAKPESVQPDLVAARHNAWRALVVVMPIILWFVLSSASTSYAAFLIKVASMGQQASVHQTRQVAKSLLASTVIGGIGAVVAWQVLSIWPSLTLYVLLIALGGLVMGPRIFFGAGMHPAGATWSYGFLTMIVVLAPAVLDLRFGSSAGAAFWSRLQMFIWATIYGTGAVFVFDVLWARKPHAGPEQNGQS